MFAVITVPPVVTDVTGGIGMESARAGKAASASKRERTASAVACLTAVFPFDIQRFQLLLLVRGGGHGPFVVVGVLWRHAPHRPLNGSGRCREGLAVVNTSAAHPPSGSRRKHMDGGNAAACWPEMWPQTHLLLTLGLFAWGQNNLHDFTPPAAGSP